ncbi:MAG: hypothetical protein DMG22_02690 [Acidobacteria bacterium]|nr:MAG: hypothetical protein DMG22_02690 [Acidobacteriota bacterium]
MHFSAVTNFAGVQAQPSLSPDGRSVAFVSNQGGHYNIYVGLVTGGSLVQISDDPNLRARPRWSPDGTKLAYARLNDSGIWDIWQVAALGGTPRRLILNATDPAWSADGRSLAYENTASGAIWISDSSGQNARELTHSDFNWAAETNPSISPDGRELAFVFRSEGPYGELAVVDLDSGKVRQLTHDGALALSPAWSPDSRFIYFTSSRGGTMNIWKIAATGGEPGQITAGQGDDAQLDVSRDGKRIVFSTYHEKSNIGQLDLEAKPGQPNLKLLTTDPARNQLAPVYSPDGKHLAYFCNFKGAEKESIWVADADGSNPVQLVEDEHINIFPHWKADGQYLIYCSHGSMAFATSEYQFRSVAVSGGSPQVVLDHAATLRFDVGPDERLLFWGPEGRIQTFDPRGNKTATLRTLPGSERTWQLGWSPDGRSIAYVLMPSKQDDSNAGLWVDDFKSSPHQIFRGWVIWYARGPRDEIYVLEGKPDLNGILWRVGWNGQELMRTSSNVPLRNSYWQTLPSDWFDISPDGHYLATEVQGVIQANIGMIENIR